MVDEVTRKWDGKVRRKIQEVEAPTKGKAHFDVAALELDRSENEQPLLISGESWSIPLQASLLLAVDKILARRLGQDSNFDFDTWRDSFEKGFTQELEQNVNKPWGMPLANRPKIVELRTGSGKLIKLILDRENLLNFHVFAGRDYVDCVNQIMVFWNTYQLIKNKDIGTWLGYPIAEYLRIYPRLDISLQILLPTEPRAPFTPQRIAPGGFVYTITPRQVTIPFVKREALTYNYLRNLVCGGDSGLDWGAWSARSYISLNPNETRLKGLSQIVVGGSTQAEAERNLDRFVALTSAHEVHRSTTESKEFGSRAKNPRFKHLKKFKVYPGWCFLLNSKLIQADDLLHKGRQVAAGKMLSDEAKLVLWLKEEPLNWSSVVADIVSRSRSLT